MFPNTTQLWKLQELYLGVGLLGYPATVHRFVSCCKELTFLDLSYRGEDCGVDEPGEVNNSLLELWRLGNLRKLVILDRLLCFGRDSYKALARLTSVSAIALTLHQSYTLDSLLQLTSCRALRDLRVTYCEEIAPDDQWTEHYVNLQVSRHHSCM